MIRLPVLSLQKLVMRPAGPRPHSHSATLGVEAPRRRASDRSKAATKAPVQPAPITKTSNLLEGEPGGPGGPFVVPLDFPLELPLDPLDPMDLP